MRFSPTVGCGFKPFPVFLLFEVKHFVTLEDDSLGRWAPASRRWRGRKERTRFRPRYCRPL